MMECVIYDGILMIMLRNFDWYLCSILLEFAAVPQSWIPYVRIGFSMVLYNSILFSSANCKFLPRVPIMTSFLYECLEVNLGEFVAM
jgi:hypothetical protein